MPIFEYECAKCATRTEHLQLSSGAPLTACPKCGGEVRKLMSAPAFQFKGSGWYVTDYASKGKLSESAEGNGGKEKTSADSSEPSETKKSKPAADSSSTKSASSKSSAAKTTSPSD